MVTHDGVAKCFHTEQSGLTLKASRGVCETAIAGSVLTAPQSCSHDLAEPVPVTPSYALDRRREFASEVTPPSFTMERLLEK